MKLRRFRFGLAALTGVACLGLLLAGPLDAASRTAPGTGRPAITDRYIVTLRNLAPAGTTAAATVLAAPGTAAASAARIAESARVARVDRTIQSVSARHGIHPGTTYHYALQGFAATLSNAQVAGLRADPQVLSITAVHPVYPAGESVPTGVKRVGAAPSTNPPIAELSNVTVAVLDTGIRYIAGDPELHVASRGIDCAKDALTGKPGHKAWADVDTSEGHGTHVSGTIGARNTGTGIVGVAPGVELVSVRIFANQGGGLTGDTETVACGVDWVASTRLPNPPQGSRPIDVANMSIQGPIEAGDGSSCPTPAGSGDAEHAAICSASSLGITFVVAAGNSSRTAALTVPAAYDSVITVSALSDYDGKPGALDSNNGCSGDPDDSFASYSNFGAPVDLIAPGSCIVSLGIAGGTTHSMSGTSMATPHVTGAAALYVALLRQAGVPRDAAHINTNVIKAGLRATAGFNWTTASDPDGKPDRLLDVAALRDTAQSVNVWAFPALVKSGAPTGVATDVHSTIAVELQRVGRYNGTATITAVANPPTGITVTPANPTLTGLNVSTTLDVSVGASAPDGDVQITLTVSGAPAAPAISAQTIVTLRVDRHKPVIQAFNAAFVAGVQLGDAQPARLSWSGTDLGSGIARYEIQRQVGASTWSAFSLSTPTATSVVRLVPRKTASAYRLRAIDQVGNASDWTVLNLHVGTRDSTKPAITYSQSWTLRTKASAFGGSFQRSTTANAYAVMNFTGRSVAWVAPVGPGKGTAHVYVDSHLVATVSLANPHQKVQQLVWASGPLAPGTHQLEIKVVGGTVDLDAILIFN